MTTFVESVICQHCGSLVNLHKIDLYIYVKTSYRIFLVSDFVNNTFHKLFFFHIIEVK